MWYGFERGTGRCYVQRICEVEPADPGELGWLEVDHERAPTEGFWRVKDGVLLEVLGSPEEDLQRAERVAAARARAQARRLEPPRLERAPGPPRA